MGDPSPAAAEVYYQRFDVRVLKADGAVPPDAGDVFVVHSRCDSEDARDKRGGPASATPTRVLPRDGPLGDTRRAIIKAAALPPAAQREARVWLKVAVEDDRQTDAVGPLGEQRFWKARAAADDDDGWLLLADDDDDTLLGLILRPASKARRWGALVEARCADGSWPRDSQWRAALRVGQVVDARDSEGRWFDAIVIDLDAVKGAKVHFRGWSSKWDAWLGLHPNDAPLAKLFTHTDHWRMLLRREDACEVRSEDAVKPLWYEGRVTDIDAGGRVEVSPLMAGTAASRHMAPRWVETTSEEICKMGTHIKKALPRAATAASAHGLQDRAIARGTIHETKEDPPPAAAGPMPCCICDEPGGKRCTTCKSRCYCSKACQLVDWKERGHKAQCKQLTPEFQDRLRGLIELMSNLMKLNIEEEPAVVDVASAAGFNAAPRLPTGREEKTAEGEATTLNDDAPDWLGRRGTCPICHDLLPSGEGATFYNCCCQSLCTACSVECVKHNKHCPLCRELPSMSNAAIVRRLQAHVDKGNARAQVQLADAYQFGNLGLKKNPKRAFELYGLAAAQGHALAQARLGICYQNGEGVEIDYETAAQWFRRSAEQGYPGAQSFLGIAFYSGHGVAQSYDEAVRWWRLAAAKACGEPSRDHGEGIALYNLGKCYDRGHGVPRDDYEALRFYKRAAAQGHAGAAKFVEAAEGEL